MRDDFSTSAWADHSPKLYQDIADGLAKLRVVFERIVAIEFDAPWKNAGAAGKEGCTNC